ncbi:peptidase inhibitor family I36 protein [Streptomyces sp. TRM 70351]|uniref:peptidase inhibitor family I36 protein n=1 Tax=Streptomyces sp. TRM 70351 TaxID=3116552 RepID=UPI002E7AB6D5|nr:peptidase inhibitor family I36 protein [Streptomyces sp. TRM 70351]MEE1928658.1 peptidase inhibitor family I36 protein [Streptomyces sp. TRM 70351]
MRCLRRKLAAVAVAGMLGATALGTPGATAGEETEEAWGACARGHVCFYTGANGTGAKCAWSVADPDWTQGAQRCSWSQSRNVKSVWNRGTATNFSGVAYYQWRNYSTRKGCTRQDRRGNLAGTYMLKSHQWVKGACG